MVCRGHVCDEHQRHRLEDLGASLGRLDESSLFFARLWLGLGSMTMAGAGVWGSGSGWAKGMAVSGCPCKVGVFDGHGEHGRKVPAA